MDTKSPLISQVKLFISQYGYTALAILVIGLGSGCTLLDPKVSDPNDPTKRVTRDELATSAEVSAATIKAKFADIDAQYAGIKKQADKLAIEYKSRYEELDQKDKARIKLLGVIDNVVSTIPLPYGGLASSALAILAGGLTLDNRRKDQQIKQRDVSIKTLESLASTGQTPAGTAVVPTVSGTDGKPIS